MQTKAYASASFWSRPDGSGVAEVRLRLRLYGLEENPYIFLDNREA